MVVDGPGTIGPHPFGAGTTWRAAGDSFFGSRCKAEGGGKKLATDVAGLRSRRRPSSPVFGQTKPIEDARGDGLKRQSEETAIGDNDRGPLHRLAPNGYSGSAIEVPNLIVAVMTCSTSPSLAGNGGRDSARPSRERSPRLAGAQDGPTRV